jgi:hypothetical protein
MQEIGRGERLEKTYFNEIIVSKILVNSKQKNSTFSNNIKI